MGATIKRIAHACLWLFPLCAWSADVKIPVSAMTGAETPRYFTLDIGIDTYQDEFWPPLKWPANDAARVSELFGVKTGHQVNKFTLLNEDATAARVHALLKQVSDTVAPSDTVVLYISAHGSLVQNASGDLEQVVVLHDTRKNKLLETGLTHADLLQWLEGLRSRKKLIILATCYSGEGKSRLPPEVMRMVRSNKGAAIPLADASEGSLVLAAAARGEPAREDDRLRGDVYTYYLLEALTTYDRNKDGTVSALEAHDYARDRTWHYTDGAQRPTANIKLVGDADIALFGKRISSGLPVLEAYDERYSGFQLEVDGNKKGVLPLAFPLDPTGSSVTLYSPGDSPVASYRVKADPGETVSLDEVMNYRPLEVTLQRRKYLVFGAAWKRLTGQSYLQAKDFGARLNWQSFGFGVNYSASETRCILINSTQLLSRTQLESLMFATEYHLFANLFDLSLRLEGGRSSCETRCATPMVITCVKVLRNTPMARPCPWATA